MQTIGIPAVSTTLSDSNKCGELAAMPVGGDAARCAGRTASFMFPEFTWLGTLIRGLPAIPAGRQPWVGFVLGCLLGPFGVGVYLRSWLDFLLITAGVIVAVVLVALAHAPTIGNFVPLLWGLWALLRIKHGRTTRAMPVDAHGYSAQSR